MQGIELDNDTQKTYLAYLNWVDKLDAGSKNASARTSVVSHRPPSCAVVPKIGGGAAPSEQVSRFIEQLSDPTNTPAHPPHSPKKTEQTEQSRKASGISDEWEDVSVKELGSRDILSSAKSRRVALKHLQSTTPVDAGDRSDHRKIRLSPGSSLETLSDVATHTLAEALEIETADISSAKAHIADVLKKCSSMLFATRFSSPYRNEYGDTAYDIPNIDKAVADLNKAYPGVLSAKDIADLKDAAEYLHLDIGVARDTDPQRVGLFFGKTANSNDDRQNWITLAGGAGPSYEKVIAVADIFAKLAYCTNGTNGAHTPPLEFDFVSGLSLGGGVAKAFKARLASTPLDDAAAKVRAEKKAPPMILFDPQLLNKKQTRMAGPPAKGVAFTINRPDKRRKTLMSWMKGLGFNRTGLVEVQMPLRQDDGLKQRLWNKDTGKYLSDGLLSRVKHTFSPGYRRTHELRQSNVEYETAWSYSTPRTRFPMGYHGEPLQYERCLNRLLNPVRFTHADADLRVATHLARTA